jgi:hypothetical protein
VSKVATEGDEDGDFSDIESEDSSNNSDLENDDDE